MVDTRSSPRVGHVRASPSSARTPAQPVRRAACANNASPQSPAARASLVARVGAGAASPARRRRVLSKRRARAPLPPSASWYPFPRNAQCAYPGIGPHRSIGFLVGEPRRSVRIFGENVHRLFSLKVLQLKPHQRLFSMIFFIILTLKTSWETRQTPEAGNRSVPTASFSSAYFTQERWFKSFSFFISSGFSDFQPLKFSEAFCAAVWAFTLRARG